MIDYEFIKRVKGSPDFLGNYRRKPLPAGLTDCDIRKENRARDLNVYWKAVKNLNS